jgi:hypothetical protein
MRLPGAAHTVLASLQESLVFRYECLAGFILVSTPDATGRS